MPTNIVPTGISVGTLTVTPYEAFFGATGQIYRRVDIYESDGVTLWKGNVPILDGSVSFDMNRDERRTFDLTIDDEFGEYRSNANNGFWYDKVIKIYRGVQDSAGNYQAYQLGEFIPEVITEPHFPNIIKCSGRDYTKRMIEAAFTAATAFVVGSSIESVISGIATGAGITKKNLPVTGLALTREFFFEVGVTRWQACKDICEAYGYELFFSADGSLTMRKFIDPTTAAVDFTFLTGATEGNLASYEVSTKDTRVKNSIVVKGSSSATAPVVGTAKNTEPSSPTRIARLGERVYVYDSKIITTTTDANALAAAFLKIMGLESYELKIDALVVPWLEAGVAIEFIDPIPVLGAPTRFLLTDGQIPLTLSTMSLGAGRVTIVK
jgi:hypothetical protein